MKVFSLEKYKEWCKDTENPDKYLGFAWPKLCEGLSERNMKRIDKRTCDAWMIEKGEEK